MRKSISFSTLLGAWIVAALFLAPVWAQEKHQLLISSEGAKSRYVQQHMIDVDDAPGHQIRVSNYTDSIGPTWGFHTWITDKGSKIFSETYGTSESQVTDTGSKRGTYNGTTQIVGGTGRFSKIRGTLVELAKFDTDPTSGYSLADSHGKYWFEK